MHNNRKKQELYGRKSNKLPQRWDKYTTIGNVVPGTRFLPFKTPLREDICKRTLPENNWFTPAMLLEKAPNLKLIIDLTQTDRYYPREYFVGNGIRHKKIVCPGGGKQLPSRHIIHEFNRAIDAFLQSEEALNGDALIGVHCTHGLNRTGYLICKYMVERSGISANTAIEAFENARGHKMERDVYINDLLRNASSPTPSPRQNNMIRYDLPPSGPHHPNRLNRMANQQPYQRYSPLDGCYNETRSRYSDRRVFYPQFR